MANTNVVPQGLFGPGILWLTRTDITAATPTNIGYINEFSYDFSFETKQLYGQNQFALLAARGTAKSTGKMKAATLSGQALNSVLIGGTWTAGTQYDATTVVHAAAASVTPTVPSSGTFNSDLGLTYQATGEPLVLVTSAPSVGQYEVNVSTGVYTLNASESGNINFSFSYSFT